MATSQPHAYALPTQNGDIPQSTPTLLRQPKPREAAEVLVEFSKAVKFPVAVGAHNADAKEYEDLMLRKFFPHIAAGGTKEREEAIQKQVELFAASNSGKVRTAMKVSEAVLEAVGKAAPWAKACYEVVIKELIKLEKP